MKAPDEALHETAEPKPMTAVDERDNAVARVRASGPDSKGLLKRAQALGKVWAALATKRETRAEVGPWECHAAGCLSTIVSGPRRSRGPHERPFARGRVSHLGVAKDEERPD